MSDVPPLDRHSPLSHFRGDAVLGSFLVLGLTTFLLTYALSFTVDARRMRAPYLFLSESIDFAPSSCLGSFLLSPACALMAVVVLLRKEQLAPVTPPQPLWWLGPLGALGGHGVASFQVHNTPVVHFAFAALFFGATTLYVMLSVRHEHVHSAPTRSEVCARVRIASAVFAPLLVLSAAVLVPFIVAAVANGEAVSFDDSSDEPAGTHIAVYVTLLSFVEISIYLNFAAYFASLLPELRAVQMGFKVTRLGSGYTVGDGTLNEPFINYVANI
jgi:hypothetical protein